MGPLDSRPGAAGGDVGKTGPVAGRGLHGRPAQNLAVLLDTGPRGDATGVRGSLDLECERLLDGGRTPELDAQRRGLAGHAEVAVVVLDGAIEEHGQEPAMDPPGGTLVC